jgi:hypothetical protein
MKLIPREYFCAELIVEDGIASRFEKCQTTTQGKRATIVWCVPKLRNSNSSFFGSNYRKLNVRDARILFRLGRLCG